MFGSVALDCKTALMFAASVCAVCLVAVLGCGRSGAPVARDTSAEELRRVQSRVHNDGVETTRLARFGIHVVLITPTSRCVKVSLANPTVPNRRFLRQRYGNLVCPDTRPMETRPDACPGEPDQASAIGPRTVPDVRGVALYAAEVRIIEAELRYSLHCGRGFGSVPQARAIVPGRYSLERAAVIHAQCPPPGTAVQVGSVVALTARVTLPGGFIFEIPGARGDCAG